jgi:hypothetical protein
MVSWNMLEKHRRCEGGEEGWNQSGCNQPNQATPFCVSGFRSQARWKQRTELEGFMEQASDWGGDDGVQECSLWVKS